MRRFAGLSAALVLLSDCRLSEPPGDCVSGVDLGETIELEIVAELETDGTWIWEPWTRDTLPRCGTRDPLGIGTFRFRVERRAPVGKGATCHVYALRPLDPSLVGTWSSGAIGDAALSSHLLVPTTCGDEANWLMRLIRAPELDPDPFGERAVPGTRPPIVVLRERNPACGGAEPYCADYWVGEIRHVAPTADAGPDGS